MSNVCAVHGTNPAGCKSRYQVSAEPKVSQRASASPRGGVRRKPKTKSRGDEQKPDMRRDASGASGHVTAKPSICKAGGNAGVGAFCKSGAYARTDSCLTAGDLGDVANSIGRATGRWATGAEHRREVSRGRSRQGRGLKPTKPAEGLNGARQGLQERDGNASEVKGTASAPDEARGCARHQIPVASSCPVYTLGRLNLLNRRVRDQYARWCRREGAVRFLPIPIMRQEHNVGGNYGTARTNSNGERREYEKQ
jgi:hypothetical protein